MAMLCSIGNYDFVIKSNYNLIYSWDWTNFFDLTILQQLMFYMKHF